MVGTSAARSAGRAGSCAEGRDYLSQVGYIDSSGIAALVEGFQNARGRGQPFELAAVSPSVLAVLKLARLDRVFPIRGMEPG